MLSLGVRYPAMPTAAVPLRSFTHFTATQIFAREQLPSPEMIGFDRYPPAMARAGTSRVERASDELENAPDIRGIERWQAAHIDAVFDADNAQRWYVVIRESRK